MSVSITEIARRLNLSHSTVSRVLNDRGKNFASEDTARQIRELAVELNYRPNRLASGLQRGKTNLVGVVMGRCNESFAARILEGIRKACLDLGYQVLLGRADNDEHAEATQVRLLLDYRVDGLICVADGWGHERILHWIDEVAMRELPCVVVDSRAYSQHADCVTTNDIAGAKAGTRHLIELGHHRIAHIGAGNGRTTSIDRRNGYLAALAEAGLPLDIALVRGADYAGDAAVKATEALLELRPLPTAIFVASDGLAYWVCETLRERGFKVPEDISIVGYGNLEVSVGMGLTTMDQQSARIGAMAAERVFRRMEGHAEPFRVIELDTELIVRRSTTRVTPV